MALPDREMTHEEREQLFKLLEVFLGSSGWKWFRKQIEVKYEEHIRRILGAPLTDDMHVKIAHDRGAAQALKMLLDLPANTLDSLERDLGLKEPDRATPGEEDPEA